MKEYKLCRLYRNENLINHMIYKCCEINQCWEYVEGTLKHILGVPVKLTKKQKLLGQPKRKIQNNWKSARLQLMDIAIANMQITIWRTTYNDTEDQIIPSIIARWKQLMQKAATDIKNNSSFTLYYSTTLRSTNEIIILGSDQWIPFLKKYMTRIQEEEVARNFRVKIKPPTAITPLKRTIPQCAE